MGGRGGRCQSRLPLGTSPAQPDDGEACRMAGGRQLGGELAWLLRRVLARPRRPPPWESAGRDQARPQRAEQCGAEDRAERTEDRAARGGECPRAGPARGGLSQIPARRAASSQARLSALWGCPTCLPRTPLGPAGSSLAQRSRHGSWTRTGHSKGEPPPGSGGQGSGVSWMCPPAFYPVSSGPLSNHLILLLWVGRGGKCGLWGMEGEVLAQGCLQDTPHPLPPLVPAGSGVGHTPSAPFLSSKVLCTPRAPGLRESEFLSPHPRGAQSTMACLLPAGVSELTQRRGGGGDVGGRGGGQTHFAQLSHTLLLL